jgi:hypothetical protein
LQIVFLIFAIPAVCGAFAVFGLLHARKSLQRLALKST